MDYKEKYNKLVEAIKVLQKTNPSDEGIQNWVNDNVPELKESEDDEEIVKLADEYYDKVLLKECGMKEKEAHHCRLSYIHGAKAMLERQKHKSSDWNEEDEAYVLLIDSICENSETEYYDRPDSIIRKKIVNARNWLKNLKDRVYPQLKQDWRPNEEQMIALEESSGIVGMFTQRGMNLHSLYDDLKKLI